MNSPGGDAQGARPPRARGGPARGIGGPASGSGQEKRAGPPYADADDLARLGLSGRALLGVEPDTVDDALVAASRFADSYLQNRYNTPILSWNEDLTLNTAKLAAWTVLSARGYDPSNPHDVILRTEWEDAVAWLEDVADGRAHLTPPITESPGGGPSGFSTTQHIVF